MQYPYQTKLIIFCQIEIKLIIFCQIEIKLKVIYQQPNSQYKLNAPTKGLNVKNLNMDNLRAKLNQDGLTQNEIETTIMMITGSSIKDISDTLKISNVSAQERVDSVKDSLGLISYAQVIVYCLPHLPFVSMGGL